MEDVWRVLQKLKVCICAKVVASHWGRRRDSPSWMILWLFETASASRAPLPRRNRWSKSQFSRLRPDPTCCCPPPSLSPAVSLLGNKRGQRTSIIVSRPRVLRMRKSGIGQNQNWVWRGVGQEKDQSRRTKEGGSWRKTFCCYLLSVLYK